MPELPEVETVRRTLKTLIIGKEIEKVEIYYDKIITGDAKEFARKLKGQIFCDIDRIGKYLIFILDQDAIISHLRMEGKYNFYQHDMPQTKHEHLAFYFTDGSKLAYFDVRKFGRLQLASNRNYRYELPLKKLGPEPKEADSKKIYERMHKSSLPIKSLLLDQSIMSGIGNIYANEICFRAGLHPETKGLDLSQKRVAEVIKKASEILAESIELGGTTIHSFEANGNIGKFQNKLQVHGQEICPNCGGKIKKIKVGGRGTYYCPNCQLKNK